MKHDIVRRCVFRPYRRGFGPAFYLTVWDTHRRCETGQSLLGYRLRAEGKTLFGGEDLGCSPMHAIDSDECMASLMSFLTLQPGDTDPDYFADYTPAQLEFCDQHAEALSAEVNSRFGEV